MRLLLCCPIVLDPRLGTAKVWLELADALRGQGADVTLLSPPRLGVRRTFTAGDWSRLSKALRRQIRAAGGEFDVVEVDHEFLPFPRRDFDRRMLLVARSTLLVHHLMSISPPLPRGPRAWAGRLLFGARRAALRRIRIESADATIAAADLINVSNTHDRDALLREGVNPQKVVVLPFGISSQRRQDFESACPLDPPRTPCVGFVGTFDYRKGALDWPTILERIAADVPDVRLKLLGTDGMWRGESAVLRQFPRRFRSRIEIVPRFEPASLPQLLSDCSVGVFPSYLEGFGLGVLEMLAAAVPVIAYDSPGPGMILDPQHLVAAGDVQSLSQRVCGLLLDDAVLSAARQAARARAAKFDWDAIAADTLRCYRKARCGR